MKSHLLASGAPKPPDSSATRKMERMRMRMKTVVNARAMARVRAISGEEFD
jgi:hypothetical protein